MSHVESNHAFVELLEQLTAMTRLGSLDWEDMPGQDAYVATHHKGDVASTFLLERSAMESRDPIGIRKLDCDFLLTVESAGPHSTDKISFGEKELGAAQPLEELYDLVSTTRKVETVRRVLHSLRGGE